MRIFKGMLLLIAGILLIDSVVLLAMRKVNVGTILPLLIGLAMLWHTLQWQSLQQFLQRHPKLKQLWRFGMLGFVGWLISLVVFVGYLRTHLLNTEHIPAVNAIIVLGSGSRDGQPTPTLAKRLDASVPIAKANPTAPVILSGGVDVGETDSEAQAMQNYLIKIHYLSPSQLVLEDKSTSTELNLKNSQPLLAQHGIALSAPIAIVTSDFHTLRANAIAKKQGYQQVYAIGSETPLSTRYNAWLREYFAFVSGWVLGEY
ncbi:MULTISPECIES: YdcF family protein [unclassified Moraxella]|uniref:YdcF family protein n=1 Tax=unclassified Moraxella TaxID=2685852 RepID=UPI003AF7D9CA